VIYTYLIRSAILINVACFDRLSDFITRKSIVLRSIEQCGFGGDESFRNLRGHHLRTISLFVFVFFQRKKMFLRLKNHIYTLEENRSFFFLKQYPFKSDFLKRGKVFQGKQKLRTLFVLWGRGLFLLALFCASGGIQRYSMCVFCLVFEIIDNHIPSFEGDPPSMTVCPPN